MTEPTTLSPSSESGSSRILGTLLVDSGVLRQRDLERVVHAQRETGERIGEAAIRLGLVHEEDVARTLARQLGLPFEEGPVSPDPSATRLVRPAFARKRKVLPLRLDGRSLQVAMQDPLDLSILDDLQFQSGRRVKVVVVAPSTLTEGLAAAYEGEVSELARELPSGPEKARAGGDIVPAGSPLVRIVDLLLRRAIDNGASDLHVEQGAGDLIVRERVDGVLRRVTELPPGARMSLLARIKVLAGMDISVRRRPQDGGFIFSHADRSLSVRVSTLPVEGGEKAVLRFLDPSAAPVDLQALGLSPEDLGRLRSLARGGRGVVLAAGPTGSGKSSTLFGSLGEVNRSEMNIVTLEDPIEYRMNGVNQVQVDPRSGLTFPSALRSVLRQDPDVVMVGEIRDRETAEIAMAAAITGHLVLSTIHTIDAPAAVTRLLQMGVQPHLVAGGLAGIVAQRLVRRCCEACGGRTAGCSVCHEGYRGRTGVFQVLVVTEALREAIGRKAGAGELRRRAEEAGMGTMADDARRKVAEGITTPHEVARVLREDPGEAVPCFRCRAGLPPDGKGCPHCGWPRIRACVCGKILQQAWKYCSQCLRRAPPPIESS